MTWRYDDTVAATRDLFTSFPDLVVAIAGCEGDRAHCVFETSEMIARGRYHRAADVEAVATEPGRIWRSIVRDVHAEPTSLQYDTRKPNCSWRG